MTKKAMNIGFHFLEAAAKTPERIAIMDEEIAISCKSFRALVISVAQNMAVKGVNRDSLIAVRATDPTVILSTLLAAALLGARWVFAKDGLDQIEELKVTHWFQTELEGAAIRPDAIFIDETWASTPDGSVFSEEQFPGFEREDDTFLFVSTSGTTGKPKYVSISAKNLWMRNEAFRQQENLLGQRVSLLFKPHSPPFLCRALGVLSGGGTLVHSTSPNFWLSHNVSLVVGSPGQLQGRLEHEAPRGKLGKVLVGGGALSEKLIKTLLQDFTEVVSVYGSTETNSSIYKTLKLGDAGEVLSSFKFLDAEIEVVDENGKRLGRGDEGHLRIKTPHMVHGYVNDPDAARKAFRDGWFYPGDIAVRSLRDEIVLVGRSNDQFNIGGTKINGQTIDLALLSVDGVEDAISFMMPHPDGSETLAAFIKTKAGADPLKVISDAKIQITLMAGDIAMPKRMMFSKTIPRTESGKPNRRACVLMVKSSPEYKKQH
ncbi:class I adenylate-forming enzyme family protein [Actibacterium pelagium]|uniref:Acyl-CoA synthetase (AMP-forming)/AMP-acid ligase II n=1 Tax=Actibacterium pelagium TaxID=2029103 RepID=A0A917ALJ9_9RHOB|nr:class I adenylate-forming enzyme family protein [Actibacterium pelagium]GGE59132.1 hypothetical protein GCM10011517_28560 [Actibacterium pelagium]